MEDKVKDALKTVKSICRGTTDCRKCEFFANNVNDTPIGQCALQLSPAYWHLDSLWNNSLEKEIRQHE